MGKTAKLVDALPRVAHPEASTDALPVITVTPFETLQRSILVLLRDKYRELKKKESSDEAEATADYYAQVFVATSCEELKSLFVFDTMPGIDEKNLDAVPASGLSAWFGRTPAKISLKDKIRQLIEATQRDEAEESKAAAGAKTDCAAGAGSGTGAAGDIPSHSVAATGGASATIYPAAGAGNGSLYPCVTPATAHLAEKNALSKLFNIILRLCH